MLNETSWYSVFCAPIYFGDFQEFIVFEEKYRTFWYTFYLVNPYRAEILAWPDDYFIEKNVKKN